MTSFGVKTTGFVEKTLQDILSEIEDDEKAAFGAGTDVATDAPLGVLNGIFGDQVAELWELGGGIYRALYPDSAEDESLDNVSALTGTIREEPTNTIAPVSLNLDPATTVPSGSVVRNSVTGDRFATAADATNSGSDNANIAATAQAEQTGPIQADAGSIDEIVTPISGWTAKAAINSGNSEPFALTDGQTLDVEVDGAAVQIATFNTGDFSDIGAATAAEVTAVIATDITSPSVTSFDASGQVRIVSDTDGPGSSLEITGGSANPAFGFSTTKVAGLNFADETTLGRDLEVDTELRLRREDDLRAQGNAALDAIRADVLEVDGVDEAFVFENTTDSVDAAGLPPHSVEVVISGPSADDQEVADAVFASVGGGIRTFGTTSKTVTDNQGTDHIISFSRAVKIEIFIDTTLVVNTDPLLGPVYPSDGDAQVKAALVADGELLGIDDDVIFELIKCAVFDVSGVKDITDFFIDTSASPAATANIPIASREISDFDTTRIDVAT